VVRDTGELTTEGSSFIDSIFSKYVETQQQAAKWGSASAGTRALGGKAFNTVHSRAVSFGRSRHQSSVTCQVVIKLEFHAEFGFEHYLKIRAMFECVAVRIARANNKCRNVASDTGMAQGTMPKFKVGTHCIGLIYAVW
jgi:hypothetical protein